MFSDYIKDNINIKAVINSIVADNDLNINTIERKLRIPIGDLSSWLENKSSKITHFQIIKTLNRLGVDVDLQLTCHKLSDPEPLRHNNVARQARNLEQSRKETKEFIGDE